MGEIFAHQLKQYDKADFSNIFEHAVGYINDFSIYRTLDINLIYYDKTLNRGRSGETHRYFLTVKKAVKGAIFGTNDYNLFKDIIYLVKQCSDEKPKFILISSGSAAEEALSFCHSFDFIKDVIIFTSDSSKYSHLKKKYKKIRMIEDISFDKVMEFLRKKNYPLAQNIEGATFLRPEIIITYEQYKEYYYKFHQKLSAYFDESMSIPTLSDEEKRSIIYYLENYESVSWGKKNIATNIIKETKNNEDIIQKIIRNYTRESILCYSLNKCLRLLDDEQYDLIKGYAGKFLYCLYKYAFDNPSKSSTDKKLVRALCLKRSEIYLYKVCEGDIICFPGFTSTSIKKLNDRLPTKGGNEIRYGTEDVSSRSCSPLSQAVIGNISEGENEVSFGVDNVVDCCFMYFFYTYDPNAKYPVAVNITSISACKDEEERLFPPFSFFRINEVRIKSGSKKDPHEIFLTVVNKSYSLEKYVKNGKIPCYDSDSNTMKIKDI